tara:strand:+ start:562 stop:849 length:288 start_codon:yes stop_codon:yes gene_type:complete
MANKIKPKSLTYNGYKNYQTWSAIISIQNDKAVNKIAEKDNVSSFDKLLAEVLNLQAETLHGVDWIDRQIDVKTMNQALSEWPAFRANNHRFNSL